MTSLKDSKPKHQSTSQARNALLKIRSGFVTIVGRPNVGKSTLMNALVGSKIAIVTDRPQTTRSAISGVLTVDASYPYVGEYLRTLSRSTELITAADAHQPLAQVIFLDTPGIFEPENRLGKQMMEQVRDSLAERDLLLFLSDASQPFSRKDEAALDLVRKSTAPIFLVITKVDRVAKPKLLPMLERYNQLHDFREIIPVSAKTGVNLPRLVERIIAHLPEGPLYFPTDQITEQPMRFLAGELVREQIIRKTHQELPYSNAILVTKYEETPRLVKISAEIYVDRQGQKGIIIGAGGQMLKSIGTDARKELEALVGQKVFLELHVRVREGWRDDDRFLQELDWRKMAGE
jgi:GTPase